MANKQEPNKQKHNQQPNKTNENITHPPNINTMLPSLSLLLINIQTFIYFVILACLIPNSSFAPYFLKFNHGRVSQLKNTPSSPLTLISITILPTYSFYLCYLNSSFHLLYLSLFWDLIYHLSQSRTTPTIRLVIFTSQ